MDISSDLKCVTNLNEYISVTQDIVSKYLNSSILFNMSTILSLKKVKSLEIEYFNKCDENGAAVIVFELILRHPPSKTWGLLGIELISLVQYWLEAIRKHLIFHNNHWWNFTSTLINFIEDAAVVLPKPPHECLFFLIDSIETISACLREYFRVTVGPEELQHHPINIVVLICLKSKSIQDILVQETAECLLDLATNSRTDLNQSYEIIHCFNMCCAESSRANRIALRRKLDTYLARVAGAVLACGDARVQLAGAQALVRWTVPRAQRAARAAAADAWLAPHRFPAPAVAAFVDATWRNFPQDARKFVNALNQEDSAVVSLRCRSCTAGGAELVTAAGGEHWLDASAGSRSLALHRTADDDAVLLLRDSDVDKISLHREGAGAVVRVGGRPAARAVLAPEPRALRRLHALLRAAFAHRYTTSTDFESPVGVENENKLTKNADSRMEPRAGSSGGGRAGGGGRTARAGYVALGCAPPLSPSTASTSSLLMLRDKLAAFSAAVYDKEPVAVCAVPQLSNVTEVTEPEEKLNIITLKARSCGISTKNRKFSKDKSDSSHDIREKNKFISPIIEEDESNVSCLLVATTGSADDSAVSEALNRPPPDRDDRTDNIVELLAKEALEYKQPISNPASSALGQHNPEDKVDNIPPIHQKQTIISNTTTDESNTDFVENTPLDVTKINIHLKNKIMNNRDVENLNFDNQDVENFFSQHLAENSNRDVVVSPTLARKINRSSSESSIELDLIPNLMDRHLEVDGDVFECLHKMLDIVCDNLEKCVGYLHSNELTLEQRNIKQTSADITNKNNDNELNDEKSKGKSETTSNILKPKFDSKNTKVVKKGRRKKNMPKPVTPSHVLNEKQNVAVHDNVICGKESINNCNKTATNKTPNTRRKRKLYSPKDDHMIDEEVAQPDNNSIVPQNSKTDTRNKSLNTPYKEIENIRNKSLMNSHNKIRTPCSTLSPRTKKLNDIFEGLKNTIEGEKNITFAARNTRNKGAIYNFPSDSEDEDFEEKKNKIANTKKVSKRQTNTKSTRGRKVTNENENPRKKPNARGRTRKRPAKKNSNVEKPHVKLEQMRATRPNHSEHLEISFDANYNEPVGVDPEPTITSNPRMEFVRIDKAGDNVTEKRNTSKRRKQKDVKPKTENQSSNKVISDKPDEKDVTVSPLPGLVIEEICRGINVHSASICTLEGLNISADKNLSLLNSTQNLLSNVDQCFQLEHNLPDAVSIATSTESRVGKKRQLSTRKKKLDNIINKQEHKKGASKVNDTSHCAINLDTSSEKSIATFGKSPITAHGDFDEAPPSSRLLGQRISKHRGIEVGDLSSTLKDYYNRLNEEIEDPPGDRISPGTLRKRETSSSCHSKDASVSKLSPVVSIARLSPDVISRWMPSRLNSVFGSNRSSSDSDASRPTSRKVAGAKRDVEPVSVATGDDVRNRDAQHNRASMISPIMLFGDNDARRRNKSRSSSLKGSSPARQVAREDLFNASLLRNNSRVSSNRYDLRSSRKVRVLSDSRSEKITQTDIQSKSEVSSTKREYISAGRSPKRRKVLEEVQNIDSASSVSEWISRNIAEDAPGVSESLDLSTTDNIDTVLEKLDTTLHEIHYNTSKKLVGMFVEVGQSYADMQAERARTYRAGVRDVLADVVKIVDAKFADLERRCTELGAAWERGLRERARAVLRADCRQKRDMVALLRDDLRAARPARPRRQ